MLYNTEFVEGPRLPMLGHNDLPCAVQVTPDITFYATDYPFLYDGRTGEFERTEDNMPYSAYGSACGSATLPDGTRIVIVAGGRTSDASNIAQTRVQIFNVETREWSEGPELPDTLKYGEAVPYGDTFLILGGQNLDSYDVGTILEFDPLSMAWITRSEVLSLPRSFFFVTPVEKERFCDASLL